MPWNCNIILPGLEKSPSCKSQSPGAKVIMRNVRNCTKIKNQMIPWAHWAGAELMAHGGLHLRIFSPEQRTLWNLYPVNQVFFTFYPYSGRFCWISKAEKTWEFGSWRGWVPEDIWKWLKGWEWGKKIKVSVLCVTVILGVAGNLTQQIGICSRAVSLTVDLLSHKQTNKQTNLLFSQ